MTGHNQELSRENGQPPPPGTPTPVYLLSNETCTRNRFGCFCAVVSGRLVRPTQVLSNAMLYVSYLQVCSLLCTITHNIVTEPNLISFELISVIPVLKLLNRIVLGINQSQ